MKDTIEALVEKVSDDFAALKYKGQEIKLPKKSLPENTQVGDKIYITIQSKKQYQSKNDQNAKTILNEILKDEEVG